MNKTHVIQEGPPVLVSVVVGEGRITEIEIELHKEKDMHWKIVADREEKALEKKMHGWMQAYVKGDTTPPIDLLFAWPKLGAYTQMVLQTLPAIPFGSTLSYNEVAILTGNTSAARAVGNACRKNPFPLIIPCHRVIGSNGKLVGFSAGLEVKKALLEFESRIQK